MVRKNLNPVAMRNKVRSFNDLVRLRIKRRRQQLKISQEQLGAALGLYRSDYRSLEYGDQEWRLNRLFQAAAYLRMDLRDLVHGYAPPGQPATKQSEPSTEVMDGTQANLKPPPQQAGQQPATSGTLWNP